MYGLVNKIISIKNDMNILKSLKISSIVIESTSRCNLKCEMCPRKSFKQVRGDIDLSLFKKISKYFYPDISVNLSGWGEPLLHPHLPEMIRIGKKKGVEIGFTTNATLLDTEISEKLIRSGLDFIDFSVDGATKNTYEQIRQGAKFHDVINNINNFIKIKNNLNLRHICTYMTFVMMKKNIHELPLMVKLAKELEVDVLTVKNFDVITNKKDIKQVVFTHKQFNELDDEFIKFRNEIIAETISLANSLNVNFGILPVETKKSNKCQLPLTGLFISHAGDVSICCATGYPAPRMLNKKEVLKNSKRIYGNLNTDSLTNILQSKEYIECRTKATQGVVPVECKGCLLFEGI